MSLISFSPLQDGVTGVNAAATNTPLSTIYNDYNGNITNANISGSAAIDQSKLSLALTGSGAASVATSETTASSSYTDLATVTDTVTATIGTSGKAQVSISSYLQNSTATGEAFMGFAVSGASTVAASDAYSIMLQAFGNNAEGRLSGSFTVTGLTAGSNTFKAKYKTNGSGTGTFKDRRISVIPL